MSVNFQIRWYILKKIINYKEKLQIYEHFNFRRIYLYEKQYRRLKKRYNRIILHGIEFVSIGETVPRLFNLINDLYEEDKDVLHVVLPVFFEYYKGGIYNRKMFEIFGKKIYFIQAFNIDFWTYLLFVHFNSIYLGDFSKYKALQLKPVKILENNLLLPFNRAECRIGEKKLLEMGIKGEFICLHAREAKVKLIDFNQRFAYESKCRECDISTFSKTACYFNAKNVQSVRMGKYETRKCNEKYMIDYANKYYDEFMDFYILSRCKFFIGCDSGLHIACGFFGRPVLATNLITICYGGESLPDTGYDMYMPKRFYSKKNKRYLNLYEMLEVMNECAINTSKFLANGIVLEDNTEDDILEAAIEMNERMEHNWIVTEEEKKHYEQYWSIVDKWKLNHKVVKARAQGGFSGYTMYFYKISYSYLKKNLYLLDVNLNLL